ncbi:T cell receptor beta variable 12-5 [Platysternon megacephalum]|nr:T cell receptor beta variable 12-5 [Platysternon megacephalum]
MKITCVQNETSYPYMYWYKQIQGEGVRLIARSVDGSNATYEERYNATKFPITRLNTRISSMSIVDLRTQDSANYFCAASNGVGDLISQWPRAAIQKPEEAVTMNCYQNGTVRTNMLWYQQPQGEGLKLMAITYTGLSPSYEKDFNESKFVISREQQRLSVMTVKKVTARDAATYFCAANAMWRALGVFLGFQLLAGLCSGVTVTQKEKFLAIQNGSKGSIPCEHDDSSYYTVLWYQQKKGAERQLQLVATSVYGNPAVIEDQFQTRYTVARPATLNTSLTINLGTVEDTAVYFCAASAGVGDCILQWPRAAIQKPGEAVTMSCYQNNTAHTNMYGCSGAQINQTPSLVLEKGQRAQLTCKQTYGHNSMFWYRQDPGQALQLLFLFVHKQQTDKGNVTDRFQAEMPQTELLHLDISPVKPEDSAVYFCASSLDTVLQSHLLPLQKPPPLATAAPFPERGFPLHLYPQPVQ